MSFCPSPSVPRRLSNIIASGQRPLRAESHSVTETHTVTEGFCWRSWRSVPGGRVNRVNPLENLVPIAHVVSPMAAFSVHVSSHTGEPWGPLIKILLFCNSRDDSRADVFEKRSRLLESCLYAHKKTCKKFFSTYSLGGICNWCLASQLGIPIISILVLLSLSSGAMIVRGSFQTGPYMTPRP